MTSTMNTCHNYFFLKKGKKGKQKKKKVKRANCFIWSNCTFLGDFPGRFLIVLTAYGLLSVSRLFYSKEKKKEKKKNKNSRQTFHDFSPSLSVT